MSVIGFSAGAAGRNSNVDRMLARIARVAVITSPIRTGRSKKAPSDDELRSFYETRRRYYEQERVPNQLPPDTRSRPPINSGHSSQGPAAAVGLVPIRPTLGTEAAAIAAAIVDARQAYVQQRRRGI